MTEYPTPQGEDAAWVLIDTPYEAAWLRIFLDDVERLYRINPMLEFKAWEQMEDDRFFMSVKNLSNGKYLETDLSVELIEDGIIARYGSGLKKATIFSVRPQPDGTAKLSVTDDYAGTSIEEREARIGDVDTSLNQWGQALHDYLYRWKKWSWVPGWSFYMRRIWQPMKPMARRVAFILIVVTTFEFLLFLFAFSIFWLELDKYIG